MSHKTIHPKLRPWLLGYGIIYSFFSIITFAISFSPALLGNIGDIILIVTWLIFLVLFWIAYKEKSFGGDTYWKLFIPLLIIADVGGIIFLSDWTTASGGILETLMSIIFSLPLYLTVWWYAFTFLPSTQKN